jgi:hypothetical protein
VAISSPRPLPAPTVGWSVAALRHRRFPLTRPLRGHPLPTKPSVGARRGILCRKSLAPPISPGRVGVCGNPQASFVQLTRCRWTYIVEPAIGPPGEGKPSRLSYEATGWMTTMFALPGWPKSFSSKQLRLNLARRDGFSLEIEPASMVYWRSRLLFDKSKPNSAPPQGAGAE